MLVIHNFVSTHAFVENIIGLRMVYDWFKINQVDPHSFTMNICAPMSKLISVRHTAILHHTEEMGKISKLGAT